MPSRYLQDEAGVDLVDLVKTGDFYSAPCLGRAHIMLALSLKGVSGWSPTLDVGLEFMLPGDKVFTQFNRHFRPVGGSGHWQTDYHMKQITCDGNYAEFWRNPLGCIPRGVDGGAFRFEFRILGTDPRFGITAMVRC